MPFFKKNNDISEELFNNNALLLSELKCISCDKYMAKPILQCNKGHSLCNTCSSKNVCAECGSATSHVRNINLENIASKVRYPCENLTGGCKHMFIHSELRDHEMRCGQRAHKCLLSEGNCTFTSRKEELVEHANKTHRLEKVMSKSSTFACSKFKDIKSYIRLMSAYDEVFWFYYTKRHNISYWAVQYLGPDINCSKYSFDFKIHYAEDKERYIGFKKVSCLRNSEKLESGALNSFVNVKMDAVENCLAEDGKAIFSITLNKSKPKKEKNQ